MALALAHYTFTDLQKLWIAQGGAKNKSVLAAAVAMAESHGDPNAQHRNSNGTIDRGLWQINSVHGAQSTLDPYANARAAIAISKNGTDFRPWTTFRTGAHIPFLRGHANDVNVTTETGSTSDPSVGGAVSGAVDALTPTPLKEVGKFVARAGVIFELDWWKRVGLVIGGLVAILLGVGWFAKEYMPKDLPIPPIPL